MKKRKTTLLLAGFCAAATLRCLAQSPRTEKPREANAEQAIRAVLAAQQEAWNRGDVDGFMEGYWRSVELSFSGSSGVSRGWEGVRDRYRKNYPGPAAMGKLEFSGLEIRLLGPDAALVLGRWQLKREKDSPGGLFTLVWRRFPEGWKIIHDHTSLVAPPM